MARCTRAASRARSATLISSNAARIAGGGSEPAATRSQQSGCRCTVSAVELVQWQEVYAPGNVTTEQRQSRVFRDASGRVRVERLNASSGSGTVFTIVDSVAGYVYELNPATLLGIRTPIERVSSSSLAEPRAPSIAASAPQVETTDLGSRQISGVMVTGTRTTTTFKDDRQSVTSVREQWVSADLHLALLTTQHVSSGIQSTIQLTDVVRAEPDPALFQVPAGYVVRIWPAVSKS